MSSEEERFDFSDEEGEHLTKHLESLGERISDEWELVYSEKVNDPEKGFKLSEAMQKDTPQSRKWYQKVFSYFFADANPNQKSSEDNSIYKVRYAYMPSRKSSGSRPFCIRMESFTDDNIVFRKEDINQMSFRGVNRAHGHGGQNYSLLKYKGGRNCKHYWELRVYRRKVAANTEVDPRTEGAPQPTNPSEMGVRPADMPNGGAYPS
jgi:hypothetical protein